YFGTKEMFDSALEAYGLTESYIKVQLAEELEYKLKEELIFAEVVKQDNLQTDAEAHEKYIQSIITANGETFPDAESIYKYSGSGDADAGNIYLLNQSAVRESILEKYRGAE
ncbi:MAG: hypothetical protein IKJ01_05225, partial [Lachnospiraceae bacterium]|nr:hypothetical protein [Lachnospiraceae bacterium]